MGPPLITQRKTHSAVRLLTTIQQTFLEERAVSVRPSHVLQYF